jgi:hypothetical protein
MLTARRIGVERRDVARCEVDAGKSRAVRSKGENPRPEDNPREVKNDASETALEALQWLGEFYTSRA